MKSLRIAIGSQLCGIGKKKTPILEIPKRNFYSPGIETVRGVLSLWVLFSHVIVWAVVTQGGFSVPSWLSGFLDFLTHLFQTRKETHPAVLAFIVLSGYCIHRNGFRQGDFSVKPFFIRRFWRIYPIYLMALLLGCFCFFLASKINLPLIQKLSCTEELSIFAIISKIASLSALFPQYHTTSFQGNAPLHTVMVEMWLYIAYPVVVLLISSKKEFPFWPCLFIGWLIGGILAKTTGNLSWWNNGSFFSFLLFWWIGAKCIDPIFFSKIHKWRFILVVCWIAITLLLLFEFKMMRTFMVEMRKILFALLTGWLFVKLDKPSRLFSYFSWIGKPSYSLYAIHAPVSMLLLILGYTWWEAIIMTILSSIVFYFLIESPFTSLGKKIAGVYSGQSKDKLVMASFKDLG